MSGFRPAKTTSVCCSFVLVLSMAVAGCGFNRIDAALPAAVAGVTLVDLEEIQNDERMTDDEKRERIREAVDAPDNESGDRLVEFLLTFEVP